MKTFNTNPITRDELTALKETHGHDVHVPDWAESLTLARVNLRGLDDAFPASDEEKVKEYYAGLKAAVEGFRTFLTVRGVHVV
jgi:hypothetical protein